jgi:mercuric ion transport protein
MNRTTITETIRFRLADGTDEQDFLKASDGVEEKFFGTQPGYIDRELLKSDDNRWLSVLRWESMEDCRRAGEALMSSPDAGEFLQKIDADSVEIVHVARVKRYEARRRPSKRGFYAALAGTAAVAAGCFTPALVIALGAIGLGALTPHLDYVLYPALAALIAVTIVSYRRWKRARIAQGIEQRA